MSESDKHSRLNKFEKRRKNTKTISIFLIVGAFLLILLLGIWFFGGSNNETETDSTSNEEENSSDFLNTEEDYEESNGNTENDSSDNGTTTDEEAKEENGSEEEENNNEEENTETEPVEPSDDNVAEAYSGNWEPVGTEQEGSHTMNFDNGSQDRKEIKKAASIVTDIDESDMVEWWVENNGDQKAVATVSDSVETEVYRVFLSWIDNEGWQPTKVEILKENDKK